MKYGIGFVQQKYNKKYEGYYFSKYFTKKVSSLCILDVANFITVADDTNAVEVKWTKVKKKKFVLSELMFHFHKCEIFLPISMLTDKKIIVTSTKELTNKSETLLDQLSKILPTFTLLFMNETNRKIYNEFMAEVERIVKKFAERR